MSLPYENNSITHVLTVTCPECRGEAFFEFAECVKIRLKKDISYFKKSKLFEYNKRINQQGRGENLACYFHKLHSHHGLPGIDDLPDGYEITDWAHSKHLYRSFNSTAGAVFCIPCGLRRKHNLSWPDDAYFQITYKGDVLWAFDRRCTGELLDYILSADRKRSNYKYRAFLLKTPAKFQAKNARDDVVKRLSDRLGL